MLSIGPTGTALLSNGSGLYWGAGGGGGTSNGKLPITLHDGISSVNVVTNSGYLIITDRVGSTVSVALV
jgi:hypothetical protein